MHLEITTAGDCRPLGFRRPFPARRLVWTNAEGRHFGIDSGYGPAPGATANWTERLYRRVFRVRNGPPVEPCEDLLLTHYHLDHVGGVGAHSFTAPPPPTIPQKFKQLREATFPRAWSAATVSILPGATHECFGFPATSWHDLEVIHLPGHTTDHHGVYFPALHLFYVCDAVWSLQWLETGKAPIWALMLQANPSVFATTLKSLAALRQRDAGLRFRCAHDPDQAAREIISR